MKMEIYLSDTQRATFKCTRNEHRYLVPYLLLTKLSLGGEEINAELNERGEIESRE